jgi:hypothetical protein
MVKSIFSVTLLFIFCLTLKAQKADRTVGSLISTDKNFSSKVTKKGINKAFSKFADKEGITFKPEALSIKEFYSGKEIPGFHYLKWNPQYAMISKKGDLGFTSGQYEFSDGDRKDHGHYLYIWKNIYGKWKLALEIGITHPQQEDNLKPEFYNPTDYRFPIFIGPQKIQMREDIVFSTDILLGKSFKKHGNKDLKEFYDDKVRLYFPGNVPLLGKEDALNFVKKQRLMFQTSVPDFVDRSLSGDLAYTYGKTVISNKTYSYVRVWKLSEEMKWNIILDVYNKLKEE